MKKMIIDKTKYMNIGRYLRIIFMLAVLSWGTANKVWAVVGNSDIEINATNGTMSASVGALDADVEGYYRVTLTATPIFGYSITSSQIKVQPLVGPSSTQRAPGIAETINVTGSGNNFYFDLPERYDGALVTATFTPRVLTPIKKLSDIKDENGGYYIDGVFTWDERYNNIGTSGKPFKGVLDGKLVELSNGPLFDCIDGAIIKNVILNNVSISGNGNGNAGAICNEARGDSRIYNCGVLATNSNVEKDDDGYDKITSYGSTVNGSNYVGGIVGLLDGSSRVINCFSYAEIQSGDFMGGIVGYNNVETSTPATSLKTMVMNCMFYGDITGSGSIAPIYNGYIITNVGENGVSNFNYFWGGASYVRSINVYNCALMAETRFLQRFEFFRHLLNGHRELAAWWVTGIIDNKDEMKKWVMEPSQIGSTTPFPVLKTPGKYASVVNYTPSNDAYDKEHYNQGRKITTMGNDGKLSITIQMGSGGAKFGAPTGAGLKSGQSSTSIQLNITDKDPQHFNFNYGKVQLPYYNDYCIGNYTKASDNTYRVVTGWKVTVTGGSNSYTDGAEASATVNGTTGVITLSTPYNFADRKSTEKDDYDTSGRVFSQGAYFDVPEGVKSITIEPYWAKAVFLSDANPDVVYDASMSTKYDVPNVGGGVRYTNGSAYDFTDIDGNTFNLPVYTHIAKVGNENGALAALSPSSSGKVYDYAVVLVGNAHNIGISSNSSSQPYTLMSVDFDHDNEPDYSYILRFNGRNRVHPVRVDFINIPGLGMAQKSTGGQGTYNLGIMQPYGWFESTNTSLFRLTQFEYDYAGDNWANPRADSPMILQGGVIEQWVTAGASETKYKASNSVTYYHVGGNVWFKEFHLGVHQDKTQDEFVTPHPPISVTGGDFNEFYLTGLYNAPNANYDDNAECYINGGRFGKVAGTGMQGIGVAGKTPSTDDTGNIIWQIDNADIDEFYAGGINAAHIAEGNISTVITNSRVDLFCGGPKFGDMNNDKIVVTNATNCTFRAFFGAGYGGNSYNREYPTNKFDAYNYSWDSWLASVYTNEYKSKYGGVSTRIDYQFIPKSDNTLNVARLFVDYVSFSLATTYDVTSILTNCTITKSPLGRLDLFDECLGNFYGGGSLGKVSGPVKSTLINCTVKGNVFGAGYSATVPNVKVMDNSFQEEPKYDVDLGAYLDADLPSTEPYTWEHAATVNSTATAINISTHKLFTTENLEKSNLGSVSGTVTLTIKTDGSNGKSVIGTEGNSETGNVYGGGDESYVNNSTTPENASTTVTLSGNTKVLGNVYGGGNKGLVSGSATVNIEE